MFIRTVGAVHHGCIIKSAYNITFNVCLINISCIIRCGILLDVKCGVGSLMSAHKVPSYETNKRTDPVRRTQSKILVSRLRQSNNLPNAISLGRLVGREASAC